MSKSDIGKFEDLVKILLIKHENLRDNVGLLYVACVSEIRGLDYVKSVTLYDHFAYNLDITDKKIPSLGSVQRLNTRLQKFNPELRGKDWEKKQKHSNDYREDLGYVKKS